MDRKIKLDARTAKTIIALTGVFALLFIYRQQLGTVMSVLITGFVLAFILSPVCDLFAKWGLKNRALSVTVAFATAIAALLGLLLLLLPPVFLQLRELSTLATQSVQMLKQMLSRLNEFLTERSLPQINFGSINWDWLTGGLTGILSGTKDFAGNMIGAIGRFGFALMLTFYFLLYKERMLLSLELWVPSQARKMTLQMAANVTRELRQYLRGQLTIALSVGVLTGIGLLIVGAPSPLLLGALVGLFNLVPYFGPLIGGIPVVLMALGKGFSCALFSALVVFIVQQLDGFIISPRVMSGMMGLSPPAVLIAITIGSSLSGLWGMFFAIPVLLIVRICLRVWASRDEVIEKYPEM